jgi:putative nucleotidyltransferase with HDIG domain
LFNLLRNKIGTAILIAVCVFFGVGLTLVFPDALERQEMAIFDLYQARVTPPPVPERFIVVLAMERSLREVQNWPWPRQLHAQLLGRLSQAKLVVFDILFPDMSNPVDDAILAEAVVRSEKVIAAGLMVENETSGETEILLPFQEMARSVLDMGMANVEPEADGITRDYRLLWPYGDNTVPSLPLAIFQNAGGTVRSITQNEFGYLMETGDNRIQLTENFNYKVHHPTTEFPVYEYSDVLKGLVPPEAFRGAVVVVGVNAGGASDHYSIGRGQVIPGTLYVAHAAQTLMHGWVPFPAAKLWAAFCAGLMACLGAMAGALNARASYRRRLNLSLLWLVLVLAAWLISTYQVFVTLKVWLPPLFPLVLCLVSFGLLVVIKLRFLTSDWQVQRLSIDSVLFMGRLDFTDVVTTFPAYLSDHWPEIEKWSGVSLLSATVSALDSEIQSALSQLPAPERLGGESLEASVIYSKSGVNRLLIGLPDLESRVGQYTVLGWVGRKSSETLKSLAALVLSAAMHFKALEEYRARQELFMGLIRIIMGAVDAKDPTTAGHSSRVAELAKELALKVGLSQADIENIYLGGLLHDVGKLGIPDNILNKPGKLSDEEMDVMRRHPSIGSEIMKEIKLPEQVMRAINEHHERLDGQGYPNRLKGESISLVGRILRIADVFDALISKRQYKEGMPANEVYKLLKEGSQGEFDEGLVNLILNQPFEGPGVAHYLPMAEELALNPTPGIPASQLPEPMSGPGAIAPVTTEKPAPKGLPISAPVTKTGGSLAASALAAPVAMTGAQLDASALAAPVATTGTQLAASALTAPVATTGAQLDGPVQDKLDLNDMDLGDIDLGDIDLG